MEKKLVIGLFGFGTVGEGIYHMLQQTASLQAIVKKICIRNVHKPRSIDASLFTAAAAELLEDPEINVIVELIDDAAEALRIATRALQNGKAVVSANKKMIAENIEGLLQLQKQHAVPFLYEAAACASIPIIRNLEEYYDTDLLHHLYGIVNGSTNFILTQMARYGVEYASALRAAQQAGFAETDPALDVKGIDAANKLTILLLHAYGISTHPQHILHHGIDQLHTEDITHATACGCAIKLVAHARKLADGTVAAFVLPQMVKVENPLHSVHQEYNGVVLQTRFSDEQFLYGKGAGRYPTASAVLSDISALRYNYRYEYRKKSLDKKLQIAKDFYLRIYISFEWWHQVAIEDFEWIETFFSDEKRQYLTGVIPFEKLKAAAWKAAKGVSLVLCADGIIEDISSRQIRKKSLELAGADYIEKPAVTLKNLPPALKQLRQPELEEA